ncbi:sugar phosphate isomerase/epimerase family protein [Halobacterium noricense]|uniref:sugar phosphate isomerase/epimerase family protein n=1 Tax=Halobacterium noricense TaxID=223182 RepID=UPI001E320A23|nr:sugar phosphate isomerase/epimerase [Halobacterium noricense]UHH26758.1 sugar phosphate isomerase/epimerase [Halobacterium noricense]
MTQFGFQLYSLHAVDDPLPAVVERVGETPFDGVEFAGLDDATTDELNAALDSAGIDAAGAHVGLGDLETDPEGVAQTYRDLGCEAVAVSWLDPEHFASDDAATVASERLAAAADDLAEHGLDLHYHNHDQEFTDLDGAPAIDALLDAADGVGYQIDLGWVGAAGYEPLDVFETYADRIDLVHLKDYDAAAGKTVKVGEGDLDIAATVDAVRDADVDWLVYEAEEHPDSYATLDYAADVVDTYW